MGVSGALARIVDPRRAGANEGPRPKQYYIAPYLLLSSLIAFLIFRIREGMTHLFSVHDALKVAQAVLASEFMSLLLLFSLTRLEGVPRSTPLIHALILAAGLIIVSRIRTECFIRNKSIRDDCRSLRPSTSS